MLRPLTDLFPPEADPETRPRWEEFIWQVQRVLQQEVGQETEEKGQEGSH